LVKKKWISSVDATKAATIKNPTDQSVSSQQYVTGRMYKVPVLKEFPKSTAGGDPTGYSVDMNANKAGYGALPPYSSQRPEIGNSNSSSYNESEEITQ